MAQQEFDQGSTATTDTAEAAAKRDAAHKLSTTGWALFFIWIGIAFLVNIDIGIATLGIGIITLVMQIMRGVFGVKLEWFWVLVDVLFVLGGIWDLLKPDVPLVPILLIVAGLCCCYCPLGVANAGQDRPVSHHRR